MRQSILLLLCVALFSCGQGDGSGKKVDEGKIKGTTYHSDDIGWTISIPEGWTVVSEDQAEAGDQKGKEALEKATGQQFDMKNLKHLISFQKDQANTFAATTEPFKEETPGEYTEHKHALNGMIYQTYANEGIATDTSSGSETIGGLEFNTFYITIRDADGKELLNQILYSRLINDYDFVVNLNYNNPADKATMADAFKASTFEGK